MLPQRDVCVYLAPEMVTPTALSGGLAVVIDVLRATTTIVHALAAGCRSIRPCLEIEEAKLLADEMRAGRVLLAGERDGVPILGFDLGNSPREFVPEICRDNTLVLTTTNGTRAMLKATEADRVLLAAFVNFSAVCEQLRQDSRPIHMICAGSRGQVTLEDTLLAGALVDYLCEIYEVQLNDSARLAWDCFENEGGMLLEALELSQGGAILHELGYDEDIRSAACIDRFHLVPEFRQDPLRIEVGSVGIVKRHWTK